MLCFVTPALQDPPLSGSPVKIDVNASISKQKDKKDNA